MHTFGLHGHTQLVVKLQVPSGRKTTLNGSWGSITTLDLAASLDIYRNIDYIAYVYGWPFVSKFGMHDTYSRCVKFVRDWYIFI